MKIKYIDVFVQTHYVEGGPFSMSGGRTVDHYDSTLVRLETDEGAVGWGEQCSFSPSYLAGHPAGVQAAMAILAPAILGSDPREADRTFSLMESALVGHEYAKVPLDMACWDLFGKATGLSLSTLLGGARQQDIVVYKAVGLGDPEVMGGRSEQLRGLGYRIVQVKVGDDWKVDLRRIFACVEALSGVDRIIIDANGRWAQHEAVRVAGALSGLDVYLEQPCATTEECRRVRELGRHPVILDESLKSPDDLIRAWELGAMDGARLKLSRFGGITPIRKARDLCLALGLAMAIEDSAGGELVSAAVTHLAASVAPKFLLDAFLPSGEVQDRPGRRRLVVKDGRVGVPSGSGLGVVVDAESLGAPIAHFE